MAIQNSSIAASPTYTTIFNSSGTNAITTLIFCNTASYIPATPDLGLTKLTLHVVKNTNTHSNTNMILNEMPIPAGETFTFDTEKVILENGDSLQAIADTNNLSVTVSYMAV